jgi:hypothetical protein
LAYNAINVSKKQVLVKLFLHFGHTNHDDGFSFWRQSLYEKSINASAPSSIFDIHCSTRNPHATYLRDFQLQAIEDERVVKARKFSGKINDESRTYKTWRISSANVPTKHKGPQNLMKLCNHLFLGFFVFNVEIEPFVELL